MSWQSSLLKNFLHASFDTQTIKSGSVGYIILQHLNNDSHDALMKKIKNDELNVGGVRSSLNKLIRLFNQINQQEKEMKDNPKENWDKMLETYEDVTFKHAMFMEVPIEGRVIKNAEKLKEMLDKLAPAKMSGGKRR